MKDTQQREEDALQKEIQQLSVDNCLLERKLNSIKTANDSQFHSICLMAEEKLDQLLKQVSTLASQRNKSF